MTRIGAATVFAGAFAAFALAAFPARLAHGLTRGETITATGVTGTIWNARIRDLRVNGIRAGNASLHLDPVSLARGSGRLQVNSARGTAVLTIGGWQGVEHARVSLAASELGLPFVDEGTVRLDDVTVLFQGVDCRMAAGHVAMNASLALGNLELAGGVGCGDKAAIVKLSGRNADLEIALALHIEASGSYRSELRVLRVSASQRAALRLTGFTQQGSDLVRADTGRLGP